MLFLVFLIDIFLVNSLYISIMCIVKNLITQDQIFWLIYHTTEKILDSR